MSIASLEYKKPLISITLVNINEIKLQIKNLNKIKIIGIFIVPKKLQYSRNVISKAARGRGNKNIFEI